MLTGWEQGEFDEGQWKLLYEFNYKLQNYEILRGLILAKYVCFLVKQRIILIIRY